MDGTYTPKSHPKWEDLDVITTRRTKHFITRKHTMLTTRTFQKHKLFACGRFIYSKITVASKAYNKSVLFTNISANKYASHVIRRKNLFFFFFSEKGGASLPLNQQNLCIRCTNLNITSQRSGYSIRYLYRPLLFTQQERPQYQ